jgi:hypothetical protein
MAAACPTQLSHNWKTTNLENNQLIYKVQPLSEYDSGYAGRHLQHYPATRGFSERQMLDSALVYQPVTGAPVAEIASQCTTMHS